MVLTLCGQLSSISLASLPFSPSLSLPFSPLEAKAGPLKFSHHLPGWDIVQGPEPSLG